MSKKQLTPSTNENTTETTTIKSSVITILFQLLLSLERMYYKFVANLSEDRYKEAKYRLEQYEVLLKNEPSHTREGLALTVVLMIVGIPPMVMVQQPIWSIILYYFVCFLGGYTLACQLVNRDYERYPGDKKHSRLQTRCQRLKARYEQADKVREDFVYEWYYVRDLEREEAAVSTAAQSQSDNS